tara:strand:+ start:208 stop:711 length:504 start_codon:yes stop_codon:yes gene_type:complete
MAEALLIQPIDLKKFTFLDGNIDNDKILQWVKVAQDIHIQSYLGSDLLNKIKSDIEAGTLSGVYLTLLNTYIKPMLIHWAMVEYLPFSAYNVTNKGIFKTTAENAETISKNEVDFLVQKYRTLAENYSQRFVDYMVYNQSSFPEYTSNTENDIYPNHGNGQITNWYL